MDELLNELLNESTTEENNERTIPLDNLGKIDIVNSQNADESNELTQSAPELIPSFDNTKVERRGRHKKDCDCNKCQEKKGVPSSSNNSPESQTSNSLQTDKNRIQDSKISNTNPLDLSEFKRTEINANSPNEAEVNAVKYITGSLLLMLIDAVAPSILIKVLGMTNEKFKKLNSKKVRLSKDQREDLEPLANEAVKQMTINMNPLTAFFVCTSLIYATNIMTAVED